MRTVDEEHSHLTARHMSHDDTARSLHDPLVLCAHVPSMPHRGSGLQELGAPGARPSHSRNNGYAMAGPGGGGGSAPELDLSGRSGQGRNQSAVLNVLWIKEPALELHQR